MELKEKTKLSSRTLAKHLNHMTNIQIIEKKADVESGKYPIPVLYKATPELATFTNTTIARTWFASKVEVMLNESKDPLTILDVINAIHQEGFLYLLKEIQQDNNMTDGQINFYGECFLWGNYKKWISKLIEASRKIINNLDITQLLIDQAKRQITIYSTILKSYEKINQKNRDVPIK